MAQVESPIESTETEAEEAVFERKRLREDTELDMTPMIDCVFLLLIFFTVTSRPGQDSEVKLAAARNGENVTLQNCVILTVAPGEGDEPALVYKGDSVSPELLISGTLTEQEEQIKDYVQRELASGGKGYVVINAGRNVKFRETNRVAAAAALVLGEEPILNLGVMELR